MLSAAIFILSRLRKGATVLAIYHLSIKIVSRGKGKSAVAAAAYRAGETITNEYDGITHDYTRKSGIVHTEIMLPENAPHEYANRAVFWNAVEKSERYKTAQLAREIVLALPAELSKEQNISLICGYVKEHFVDAGMCADVCVHDTGGGNPHAHVMLTMRPIEKDGSWGQKSHSANGKKVPTIDWNEQSKADEWRKTWEDAANAELKRCGFDVRIDHRSYEKQGVDKIPTVHLGVAATQMERKGIATERGNRNREIAVTNSQLRQLKARIKKCKDWLYSQPLDNAPTMIDTMKHITDGKNLNTRWQRINNLQTRAKVLIFLQSNNINDMVALTDKVVQMYEQQYEVSKKIKAADRRLAVSGEHLAQYEILKQHKAVYEKHQNIDPKKQSAFYDKHHEEIRFYEDAKRYFEKIMNGRTGLPIKAWKEEHIKLTAEKYALCEEYYRVKDDVKNVEVFQKGAEGILGDSSPERTHSRSPDMNDAL